MKKAVTFRFDPALLADVRRCAQQDNRSVTNFIETLLKAHVGARWPGHAERPGLDFQAQPVSDASASSDAPHVV